MTSYAFDANILIDALAGFPLALAEISDPLEAGFDIWISRMAWLEVLSKGSPSLVHEAEAFLSTFGMDEVDVETARRAAALRRERQRLKSPDAIILASAQLRGHVLVTRNTRDFSVEMPGIRVPYTL